MAGLINIIIPLETFFDEFGLLIGQLGMHVYIETRGRGGLSLKKVSRRGDLALGGMGNYSDAFITSMEFQQEGTGAFMMMTSASMPLNCVGGGLHVMSLRIWL